MDLSGSPQSPHLHSWQSFWHRLPGEALRQIGLETTTVPVKPVGWYHMEHRYTLQQWKNSPNDWPSAEYN